MRWPTPAARTAGNADSTDSGVADAGARPGVGAAMAAAGRAAAARLLAPGPALQGLLVFVLFLVVFVVVFGRALLPHLDAAQVGQIQVDPNFYIWSWRWWTHAIAHGLNPLYSRQIGAPGGYNLAWATTAPAVALLVSPVTAVAGPVASFNLTLLLAPPASAWAAFILARRLTGKFWAALPAGIVYGFNVYELAHDVSGQPNLTVTVLFPLMAYLVLLWWDGTLGRVGYVAWMIAAMTLEFYTFVEAFAQMTLMWAAALVIGFAVARRAARPKVARLALLTVIAYAGTVLLAAPYLVSALQNYPKELTRQLPAFSLDLAGLVVPRMDRLLGMSWWAEAAQGVMKATGYVGIPLLLVLVALAVSRRSSRLTWLLVAGFVFTIALAAGPDLIVSGHQVTALPWGGLWNLPLARSAEPDRFIVFAYLILAVGLSLWLAQASRSRLAGGARWGLGALAIAAILADLPTFTEVVRPDPPNWKPAVTSATPVNDIPPFFSQGLYRQYVSPGENVVILSHRGNAGMLFQAYTDFYFNIGGGFINASLSRPDSLPLPVALLSHPTKDRERAALAYLKSARIGAVLVETNWSEHWMYVFGKLGMKTSRAGGVTIFETADARLPGR